MPGLDMNYFIDKTKQYYTILCYNEFYTLETKAKNKEKIFVKNIEDYITILEIVKKSFHYLLEDLNEEIKEKNYDIDKKTELLREKLDTKKTYEKITNGNEKKYVFSKYEFNINRFFDNDIIIEKIAFPREINFQIYNEISLENEYTSSFSSINFQSNTSFMIFKFDTINIRLFFPFENRKMEICVKNSFLVKHFPSTDELYIDLIKSDFERKNNFHILSNESVFFTLRYISDFSIDKQISFSINAKMFDTGKYVLIVPYFNNKSHDEKNFLFPITNKNNDFISLYGDHDSKISKTLLKIEKNIFINYMKSLSENKNLLNFSLNNNIINLISLGKN
jgi:hypothetical protein